MSLDVKEQARRYRYTLHALQEIDARCKADGPGESPEYSRGSATARTIALHLLETPPPSEFEPIAPEPFDEAAERYRYAVETMRETRDRSRESAAKLKATGLADYYDDGRAAGLTLALVLLGEEQPESEPAV